MIGSVYSCWFCTKSFRTKQEKILHQKSHTSFRYDPQTIAFRIQKNEICQRTESLNRTQLKRNKYHKQNMPKITGKVLRGYMTNLRLSNISFKDTPLF